MTCEKVRDSFTDFLTGEIDPQLRSTVQQHLKTCQACRQELEDLNEIWDQLGVLPENEPDPSVRTRFYSWLQTEKDESKSKQRSKPSLLIHWFKTWWPLKAPLRQFATIVIVLLVGLWIGHEVIQTGSNQDKIQTLENEINDLRRTMGFSLLTSSSPSDRLLGLQMWGELKNPPVQVLKVLLNTLNTDENTNVRLAVLDTLGKFKHNFYVRQNLIKAVNRQKSPSVQVELINFLVDIRDSRAVKAFQKLQGSEKTRPEVKKFLDQSINQLKI